MSADLRYPCLVRVPAPAGGPTLVRVPAPASPSVLRQEIPGIPGPAGPIGPAGVTTGLGQVTYTERTVTVDDVFEPGVRKQLRFDPAGTSVQDFLRSPFAGLTLFQDSRLRGRTFGDMTIGIVNLIVVAMQAGGAIKMDIDVGSDFGPTGAGGQLLMAGANVPERVTFPYFLQTLTGVLANGAAFYVTANRPLTVTSESVLVCPISIGPGA